MGTYEEQNKRIHQETSDLFLKQHLSYRFTSALLFKDTRSPLVRFLFSKPTQQNPIPKVTVMADVRPLGQQRDGCLRFSVLVEDQKYSRIITIDPKNTTGEEFNEVLINKVYDQKAKIREIGLP